MKETSTVISRQTNLVLDIDLEWNSGTKGVYFIHPAGYGFKIIDGIWYIPKGYYWNGCNYVWDGREDPNKKGFPITWKASLIHDIGCKYWRYNCFPYARPAIDKFFFNLLKEVNFKWDKTYYIGVRSDGILKEIMYSTVLSKRKC